jgi:hypothetical protein
MPVDIEALPDRIAKLPHWRVVFRPSVYKTRIDGGPKAAFSLIEKCHVRLGGWSYPFLSNDRLERIRESNYIASGSDFMGHIEYWRMYYSGQFADLLSVREKTSGNWDEKLREEARQMMLMPTNIAVADIPGFMSILNLLCSVTEIFEFATRLCVTRLYDGDFEISIELILKDSRLLPSIQELGVSTIQLLLTAFQKSQYSNQDNFWLEAQV